MSKNRGFDLRPPKGTLDYSPADVISQSSIIDRIIRIFEIHGGLPISTPAFELRSTLMNKYGEDSKLVYNLEDQGGDICSLRYDLTVPFSRYLSMNRISKMRRYQIGNVFRRDNPSFRTGRLREFTQADFDICGDGVPMQADAEILLMISEILGGLEREFVIRVNDRRIIMGMFRRCGVPEGLWTTACSTLDKADKLSWNELAEEMQKKGLTGEQVAQVKEYVEQKGSNEEKIVFLQSKFGIAELSDGLPADPAMVALSDMKRLLELVGILGAKNVVIDFSLARGLDYYTGLIIEAGIVGSEVGSIVGGGRYDNLCSSISKHSVPCVGFSVGVSRLHAILGPSKVDRGVFVGSASGLYLEERLRILKELWDAGIKAETFPGRRVNFREQKEGAAGAGFRIGVFTGETEIKEGKLIIMDFVSGEKLEVGRNEIVSKVQDKSIS